MHAHYLINSTSVYTDLIPDHIQFKLYCNISDAHYFIPEIMNIYSLVKYCYDLYMIVISVFKY